MLLRLHFSSLLLELLPLVWAAHICHTLVQVCLGDLSLDTVASLYRQAAVVVFPSKLETFGLPLVEAMASGAPVIAADASSIPEIVGDAAELFDPHSPDALRASIEALLSNRGKRSDLVTRGYLRAKQFTWSKAAARMLEVFSIAAGFHED